MAYQKVGTPRFYLDFTQLAKAKGFRFDDGEPNSQNLIPEDDDKNNNVWDFDYTNPTSYTVRQDIPFFQFRHPFWESRDNTTESSNFEWAKLMSTINFAGIINHNIYTKVYNLTGGDGTKLYPTFKFRWIDGNSTIERVQNIVNMWDGAIRQDGYSFIELAPLPDHLYIEPQRYGSFNFQLSTNGGNNLSTSTDLQFDMGCMTFGKFIDMPHSPDLSVKKSVEYDGVNIKRSLGGADFVQINHQGQPDWLVGEPWTVKNYASNGRVGRNGRRAWDLNFSYISNDDLFYDLRERVVGGSATRSDGVETAFNSTDEIQQIYDLTLGGALSFVFCPDSSKTNHYDLEFAVCKLDQDSLVATQVAFQTWNISMRVVEVW